MLPALRIAGFSPLFPTSRLFRDLDDLFAPARFTVTGSAVRWREEEVAWRLEMDLPGVSREALDVSVEGATLVIKGHRRRRDAAAEGQAMSFERVFTLPKGVDGDKVSASLEDGVLEMTLPKSEASKPRKIVVGGRG